MDVLLLGAAGSWARIGRDRQIERAGMREGAVRLILVSIAQPNDHGRVSVCMLCHVDRFEVRSFASLSLSLSLCVCVCRLHVFVVNLRLSVPPCSLALPPCPPLGLVECVYVCVGGRGWPPNE